MTYSTEGEAEKKWCPMVRDSAAVGPSGDIERSSNKMPDTGPYPYCIGSACMMWRKGVQTIDTTTDSPVTSREVSKLIIGGAEADRFITRWADYGYCGLAGRPE